MTRSRASAKKAGTSFETLIVGYLAQHVDDRIERRRLAGARDRGDVAGVRIHGQRVVIEAKNETRPDLSGALREAETERGNDDALAGVVAHKRHGRGAAAEQLVTMTLRDFAALLCGQRPAETETRTA